MNEQEQQQEQDPELLSDETIREAGGLAGLSGPQALNHLDRDQTPWEAFQQAKELAETLPRLPKPDPAQGARPPDPAKAQLSLREIRGWTPDRIEEARQAGRLDALLGAHGVEQQRQYRSM